MSYYIEFPNEIARLKRLLPWGEFATDREIDEWWRAYSEHMMASFLCLSERYDAGAILDAFVGGMEYGKKLALSTPAPDSPPPSA